MSESSSVESVLSQATQRESKYDWAGATECYKKALGLVFAQDFSKIGEIYERLGYAFYRAAMQSESANEFRTACVAAVKNYEKAKEFFTRLSELRKTQRMLRCHAMVAYVGYWLAAEVPEKKRLLDKCWRLTKESLKAFEETGDAWEYGKTYNQLSTSAGFRFFLESDYQVREKTLREAVEHGERTITFLSSFGDPRELASAYVKTAAYLQVFSAYFLDLDEKERHSQKAVDYWLKAKELSEETALIESLNPWGLGHGLGLGVGTDEALANFQKALKYAEETKDKFVVGCALDWLAYHTFWKAIATEDPDKMVDLAERALQCAEDAKHCYAPISFMSPRNGVLWVEAAHAEYYWQLTTYEADLRKRHDLLEKAVKAAQDGLKHAEDSGYPEIIEMAHHVFSKMLTILAVIEKNSEKKRGLLEKALGHRNESVRIAEQLGPFDFRGRGLILNYLADIKSELVDLAKVRDVKKITLQEAILNKENALKLCLKDMPLYEKEGSVAIFASLGRWQHEYGDLLYRLYEFTNDREDLRKAIEAFEAAAESFQKPNLMSRAAECYWKAAQAYDSLVGYSKAAENFDLASNNYKSAAEKIPQLKDFYEDHALYMQAWSEIEKARHYHARQEYGLAREHFEKAASIHKSLRHWSYLAPNYSAWAEVEYAEDLSRKEQSEEAFKAFQQAAKLFEETKKSLQTEISKIENLDEKQMAINMVKATDPRHKYCVARMALEEAKIIDKKGEHFSSSEKYGSAADTFEKIIQKLESEHDRKEIRYIAVLSRAWQKMILADARASPDLYTEASQLFEQASEHSCTEITRLLALGHSRFCKALEAGTRFTDTRDTAIHSTAMQHLQSATSYYQRAGLEKVAEYARATGLIFDAYVHMDNAKKEIDPEKKAKLYRMAEMVLQASAGSYLKAEHPAKMEQVLRLLEKVKEERELAVSLIEVLHSSPVVSTTAFPAPTPIFEKAVGLEKFEHADIQANIITRQKELKVGENLDLEIELVNAGKGPALLIKVAEVLPKGFELTEKPETYRVENGCLNMKGKRLDPLKTEEVRLVLKPKVQGVFPLKPRILYLDEDGKYKSHEPEPINITVKELGIKGWLKGEK